ncbi:hypothetical protein EDC15_10838 [Acetobacter aceti NBRC 14818]|uniref:Uncharacterized protein n=2 Tax=Acetobacter aceti TaxID=435 RepID=A0AB33IF09_ACEAC|nr:hypothetical protein EDC15_10838 [Acetobacter aceti NBRC 14818]BCK75783.1 hypothetical protein EMQ_1389 [Acetobacter aceti NBRC 14818]GAN57962.1 hypothetical protein Abac_022_095 [Acetobacter aceti NBRC 14818]
MVGAKFRINAYNKKNSLQNLFIKKYNNFKTHLTYLRKKFTISLNSHIKNFNSSNSIPQKTHITKNLLNYKNVEKIYTYNQRNLNKFINTQLKNNENKITSNSEYKGINNNTNISRNINLLNFLEYKARADKSKKNRYIQKIFPTYNGSGMLFHGLHISHIEQKQPNTSIKFINSSQSISSENIKNHSFVYYKTNHKNKITKNVMERKVGKKNLLNISGKSLNKINENTVNTSYLKNENELGNVGNLSINKTDFHEIMNFVESELNQSFRSPPSGSLMSWVQSVPSYPGLHI